MSDTFSHRPKIKDDSAGTIYVNKPKDGKQGYLNIAIDLTKLGVGDGVIKLMAFKNTFKKEAKHPDFRILMPLTKGATAGPTASKSTTNVVSDDDSGLPF